MKFLVVLVLFALLKQAGATCFAATNVPFCNGCGGGCSSGNGCLCDIDHSLLPCIPTTCDLNTNECCLAEPGYYWDSSLSCCTDVLICNPKCTRDEQCVDRSGDAVCECNYKIYKGNTTEDIIPTVDCKIDTMTTSVSRCLLIYLGYDYESFHLNNDSIDCIFHYPDIQNDQRVETNQVKAQAGWCGNDATIIDSKIYFKNTLHIQHLPSQLITKNPIAYNFSCGYNLTMQTSLQFALHPLLSTTVLTPVTGGGSFSVIMAAYKEPACSTPFVDGESVDVGTYIYLGILVKDTDGTNFTLRADECFATSINDSNYSPKVQLVSGGCAVDGEVDTAVLQNGEAMEAIIRIRSFQFQDSPNNLFIFCQVSLCEKSEACKQCLNGRSLNGNSAQLGLGFPLEDNTYSSNSGYHTVFSYVMMATSLLAFLCMSFF